MRRFENFLTEVLIYIVFRPFRLFALTIIGICLMDIYNVNTVSNVLIFSTGMIILWNAREFYIKNDIDFINYKLRELMKKEGTAEYIFKRGPERKWKFRERLTYIEEMRK